MYAYLNVQLQAQPITVTDVNLVIIKKILVFKYIFQNWLNS